MTNTVPTVDEKAIELCNFLIDNNRKILRGCTYNHDMAIALARSVAWFMAAHDLSFNEESQATVEASAEWQALDAFLCKTTAKPKRTKRNRSLSV